MKTVFLTLALTMTSAAFANECRDLCSEQNALCKQGVQKMIASVDRMIKANSDADSRSALRNQKSEMKEIQYQACRDSKSHCKDMCSRMGR